MKMSRIVEELERQGIVPTYENIAIFVQFVVEEGLVERLGLDDCNGAIPDTKQLTWLKTLFSE